MFIMKKFIFAAVSALFVFGTTASAQFMNSSSSGSAPSNSSETIFNTFDFTYSPVTMKSIEDDDTATEDLNAISLNWNQARVLTDNLPVYLTYGAGLQYAWKTDSRSSDGYKMSSTVSFLTLKVPVSVMYNLNIPNTALNLMPYVGLNVQGHLLGQQKYTAKYDGESESETINFFSEDDMDEAKLNRFVLGWQIGAKIAYDRYFFGVAYDGPVTNLFKEGDFKINTSQVNLSIGIRF